MKAKPSAEQLNVKRIVFGGTFDPPHLGHLQMAELALATFPGAKLVVIPAPVPPIAGTSAAKVPARSLEERLELCEAAFRVLPKDRLEISDIERTIESPNYTLKTLRALANGEPQVLLIGQDQLQVFPRWHKPVEILSLAAIAVVERATQAQRELPAAVRQVIIDLGGHVQSQKDGITVASWPSFKQNFFNLPGQVSDATSESIRRAVAEQGAFAQWLAPEVVDLIQKRNWYMEKI